MGELNKMETKPMLPLIVTMSVPPLISMFLQYTYNFVCLYRGFQRMRLLLFLWRFRSLRL